MSAPGPPAPRTASFEPVEGLLADAVARRVTPGAVIEVGRRDGPLWTAAAGRLTYEPDAPAAMVETVFDLASLTKVIATTTFLMQLADRGRLALTDPVARWLPEWRGVDRDHVTLADLLAHCSGLTAHLPLYRDYRGRADMQPAICQLPLEYPPRSQAVYSDLGFILLGFIVEDAAAQALDEQMVELVARLDLGDLRYRPPRAWRPRTAPTVFDPWRGRLLVGEVHDGNAWALDGVAGHSGLFGTAGAVGRFARAVLRTLTAGEPQLARPATLGRFLKKSAVPGSSRALGWDTMRPTSSCGSTMSPLAIGHTGFTGTSLWIDPAQDLYVVLLTNRIHGDGDPESIMDLRRGVHDAVITLTR